MSSEKQHERMEDLDKCYNVIRQSRQGITAVELAEKLGLHRTTVYDRLKSLEFAGKIRVDHGLWEAVENGEQKTSTLPLEASELLQRIFKQTDEIKEILYREKNPDPEQAFGRLRFLIAQLDEDMKVEMRKELEITAKKLRSVGHTDWLVGGAHWRAICRNETIRLLSRVYSLIYAKYPLKEMLGTIGKKEH